MADGDGGRHRGGLAGSVTVIRSGCEALVAMVPAGTLPAQDGHLMSQGDEFEFQRGAAAHPEREQETEGGQERDHADDGMAVAQETLHLLGGFDF